MQVFTEISTYKLRSQLTLSFQKHTLLKWSLFLNLIKTPYFITKINLSVTLIPIRK